MSMTTSDIAEHVREFLRDNFLYMRPDYLLADASRLLEDRVIDSMGVMELISFLEQRFGISVGDKEITEANLGSITAITAYVQGKVAEQG